MDATTLVTNYGPLALGWVIAFMQRKELKELNEKFHQIAMSDIEIKTGLKASLLELTKIIQKGFGDV